MTGGKWNQVQVNTWIQERLFGTSVFEESREKNRESKSHDSLFLPDSHHHQSLKKLFCDWWKSPGESSWARRAALCSTFACLPLRRHMHRRLRVDWWEKTSSQILENSSVQCLWSFTIYGYLWWISHTSEYPSLQVQRLTNHSSLHRHEWLVTARPTGFGQISLEEARGFSAANRWSRCDSQKLGDTARKKYIRIWRNTQDQLSTEVFDLLEIDYKCDE